MIRQILYLYKMVPVVLTLLLCPPLVYPQQAKGNTDTLRLSVRAQDSLQIEQLSVKLQELTSQIDEMKLNEIVLLNKQDSKEKNDSLKKARQKEQIDSLRLITKGVPLVIDSDTLFTLYARRGGLKPEERVAKARETILILGKKLTMRPDSVYTFESESITDIMLGEKVIVSITEQDALWQNTTRQELAGAYASIIAQKISSLHAAYGLQKKIKSCLLFIAVIIGQVALIVLTNKLFRRLRMYAHRFAKRKFKVISVKGYELLNVNKQRKVLLAGVGGLKYIVILIQLVISMLILFLIFPETESYVSLILSYIWDPAKGLFMSFVRFIPDIFKIALICILFRYILRAVRYFFTEIANENLKINGFYADWALPTYNILRFLLYSFMIIMIWPLLPNSDSAVFQGVSVFIGLIISLGSTTIIGNLMAGFIITYMRPFRIGDQIRLGETVGEVIEKTPFVIRIQTPKKEIITIPNSFVLSSHTTNYSTAAKDSGIIIYSDITVGYEVPRQQVEELLIEAALKTEGVLKKPEPFVLIKSLPDFYCCFQINAYTKKDQILPRTYSALHKNIIDIFNQAGIEIMSPHFYAQRDGNQTMIPRQYKQKK